MALYSSSPPAAAWCTQCTSHSGNTSCLADADVHVWSQSGHSSGSKQSRGGISYMFSSTRHSSCTVNDVLEPSILSSSRSISQCEHSLREGDSRPGSVNIPAIKRSPTSVLQSPYCNSHNSCIFALAGRESPVSTADHMIGWRSAASADLRSPAVRKEGFEVSRSQKAEATLLCGDIQTSDTVADLFLTTDSPFLGFEFGGIEDSKYSFAVDSKKQATADEILKDAQSRHYMFSESFIIKAFRVAEEAHRGLYRKSGDLYLTHCVETAALLAKAGAETTVVAAGLLHDTLDDTNTDEAQLRAIFGDDVADLVVGVSKLSQLSQLARDNDIASDMIEADRLRTMFLAMVDVRVVLVKLADRLHNMRTLGALAVEKQHRIASETLEILVPIANRLGIWSWKAEMEDLCFKHLRHTDYQELAAKLVECCRGGVVMSAIEQLDKSLRDAAVCFDDLCGRSKNLFSIYTKMKRKGRSIDEIYDVRGLRLIVRDECSCYAALDVVHRLWQHIPGKLKDYIRHPKPNGYQSLHTVVWGKDGLPLEVQIRTEEMHTQAEFGMAAHWRYKEGNDKHSSFLLQRVEWARWILTWHSEIMDTKLRVSPSQVNLKLSCPLPDNAADDDHQLTCGPPVSEDDPLFVIMLKGEKMVVRELPFGATAADLLEEDGNVMLPLRPSDRQSTVEMRARVNYRVVEDVQLKLRMGDVVEIFTAAPSTAVVAPSSSGGDGDGGVGAKVYVSKMNVYREQIRRMYGDGSCKMDARRSQKGFDIIPESPQIVGLT